MLYVLCFMAIMWVALALWFEYRRNQVLVLTNQELKNQISMYQDHIEGLRDNFSELEDAIETYILYDEIAPGPLSREEVVPFILEVHQQGWHSAAEKWEKAQKENSL